MVFVPDIKGLYKQAELGLITELTGVNAPYEAPEHADVIIDTSKTTIRDAVQCILATINDLGYAWE